MGIFLIFLTVASFFSVLLNCGENYKKRIEQYSREIEKNPKNTIAYKGRACAYNTLGNKGEALKDINTAIRLSPKDGEAYFIRYMFRCGSNDPYEYKSIMDLTDECVRDLKRSAQLGYKHAQIALDSLRAWEEVLGERFWK